MCTAEDSTMQVPGSLGYGILGDKSIELVRSPLEFIAQRRRTYGAVFQARILNKQHIFLTSNEAVEELLIGRADCFNMAYKLYLRELFDNVLLFLEGDEWKEARQLLERSFDHQSVIRAVEQSKKIIDEHVQRIQPGESMEVYKFFKELATQLSISLFLSHNMTAEEAADVSSDMTHHWRGIISVPLPITIPWAGWRSGYGKAMSSKASLLETVRERLKNGEASSIATSVSEVFQESAADHLLLFVCALIPKAMASLLTSAILELSKPGNDKWQQMILEDSSAAEDVLLEVQRLWPPFLGGARVCTRACAVAGYSIPEGAQVAYISHSANRDAAVFPRPDDFYPERWKNENVSDRDKVWTFGGGARNCIGKHLASSLLQECLVEVTRAYSWEILPDQELKYKTLPISRPKEDLKVTFTKHEQS